ncbi:MAG: four helix bundle protein [Oscillospiraceae bacterium]|nr:four helix bundle protein [Oscillospiraceae bacterium]
MNPIVQNKSFDFAVRIVNLCKYLQAEHKDYILSKQLLRSGTSIGANISESQQAQSRPDFINKLNIALKEACETDYWLRLLHKTEFLTDEQFLSIFSDCQELERLLTTIIKTTKE